MALNSFAEVAKFITDVLTENAQDAQFAPHGDFWSTLTYEEFTTGSVPKVRDADGNPIPILVVGNSGASAIIHALKGTGMFDPNTGSQSRMPSTGPPYFTDAQIQEIADWIDQRCPR